MEASRLYHLYHRLIRLGFYLLYHQMAWSYEAVAWLVSFGQWAGWRRLALDYLPPGPTLELAYGTGVFFADMLAAGRQAVGLDLSPYMARQAVRRLNRQGYDSRLCQASAEAIPFPANTFSGLVATFPTDYIFRPRTLSEAYRVLRPGGRLVIVVEGVLRGPRPLNAVLDWLYRVTGQRTLPEDRPRRQMEAYGFRADWALAGDEKIQARLLVAEKK